MNNEDVIAMFFVDTRDDDLIYKFLKSLGLNPIVGIVSKGGLFPSNGVMIRVECKETSVETLRGLFLKLPRIKTSLHIFSHLSTPFYKNVMIVNQHLCVGAFTPQEIHDETGIDMLAIANILPSDYNTNPTLNPRYASIYGIYAMEDRLVCKKTVEGYTIVNDNSYPWRFYTAFGYDEKAVEEKVKKLHDEMEESSTKRRRVADWMVNEFRWKITKTFKMPEEDAAKKFFFGIVGSARRRDSTKYSDVDLLFIYDDTDTFRRVITEDMEKGAKLSPQQVDEIKLKCIAYRCVLKAHDDFEIHVALHTASLSGFKQAIRTEAMMIPFMLMQSELLFGADFRTRLLYLLRESGFGLVIQQQVRRAERQREGNLEEFQNKILEGENPQKDKERFESVGRQMGEELKIMERYLKKVKA